MSADEERRDGQVGRRRAASIWEAWRVEQDSGSQGTSMGLELMPMENC